MSKTTINIELLKRSYSFKCGEEEVDLLKKSAKYLDGLLQQIEKQGTYQRSDVATIAALNLTSQLFKSEQTRTPQNKRAVSSQLHELHSDLKDLLESD